MTRKAYTPIVCSPLANLGQKNLEALMRRFFYHIGFGIVALTLVLSSTSNAQKAGENNNKYKDIEVVKFDIKT